MLYQSKDNAMNTQKPGEGDRPANYIRNRNTTLCQTTNCHF